MPTFEDTGVTNPVSSPASIPAPTLNEVSMFLFDCSFFSALLFKFKFGLKYLQYINKGYPRIGIIFMFKSILSFLYFIMPSWHFNGMLCGDFIRHCLTSAIVTQEFLQFLNSQSVYHVQSITCLQDRRVTPAR